MAFDFSGIKKKVSSIAEKANESLQEAKKNMAEQKAISDEAKAPVPRAFIRYQVIYLGGFPMQPQKKSNSLTLGLNIMEDCFIIKPEHLARKEWFGDENFVIPYSAVTKFEIVKRQVSSAEALLGSGDTKSLEQENNIEITYVDNLKNEHKVRIEMLSGTTVYGQAGKCRELLDLLQERQILNKWNKQSSAAPASSQPDIFEQLEKLSALKEKGIISAEEFETKKAALLDKM